MEEPEMKTIDVIICRLRKKLAEAGAPNLVQTVWGCGYILRAPQIAAEPVNSNVFSIAA
jgi:two-component system cell cycle response regulator CtrA